MRRLLTVRKLCLWLIPALAVLGLVMLICAFVGTESISPARLIASLRRPGDMSPEAEIFIKIRLPRVWLAAIVGAALSCSGAVLQGLLRNPLADPYILGISSGAGLGAILAVLSGADWMLWGRSPLAACACAGALGTVCLVWIIGRCAGRIHVTGLLLAGVVVNAVFSALILFLTSLSNSQQLQTTMFWLMGNITEEGFLVLWFSAGIVLAGLTALFFLAPKLNAVHLGDEDAHSLGVNVQAVRTAAFVITAVMTAVAVSLSGLIGFVGLVVPHAVRLLWGPDHRLLLPMAAVTGAAFLVIADTVARVVIAPAQLPVGVVTALVGGPAFLVLLIRYSRKAGGLR